ncbi:MAG: restriction endonuclease subunit S [Sedimenticola sp.]
MMLSVEELSIDKSDWSDWKLGELVYEPKETAKSLLDEGVEHVVGLEHIDSEDHHLRRSSSLEKSTTFTKKFRKGDVLFGRRRAYLKKAAVAHFDGVCSGDIIVMRAREDLMLPGLLPFLINNDRFFDFAVTHSAGGLSPRVKFKDISNMLFCLPSLEKQSEIFDLLKSIDHASETARDILENLDVLLLSMRENELCSNSFERVFLSSVLEEIVAGKSLNGESYPAQNSEKAVLKVSAVGPDGFCKDENKILKKQGEFLEKYSVRKGDVLITRANTMELVGRVCLVDEDYPNLMLSDKTLRLVFVEDKLDRIFITEVLNSFESRRQIESFATGTGNAMKNISQSEIGSIKVPLPPKNIQNHLANKISLIRRNIIQHKRHLFVLKQLRSSIIERVF